MISRGVIDIVMKLQSSKLDERPSIVAVESPTCSRGDNQMSLHEVQVSENTIDVSFKTPNVYEQVDGADGSNRYQQVDEMNNLKSLLEVCNVIIIYTTEFFTNYLFFMDGTLMMNDRYSNIIKIYR